jgi:hypothetical protein
MTTSPKLPTDAMVEAERKVRGRLANNGRNPANNNRGILVGSDLHLCEMLLAELDRVRAALAVAPRDEAVDLHERHQLQEMVTDDAFNAGLEEAAQLAKTFPLHEVGQGQRIATAILARKRSA